MTRRMFLSAIALALTSGGYAGVGDAQPVPRDPVSLDPAEVPSVLHYEQTGQGEPVVLIQGANLPMQMWDAQVRFLKAEFRVVRYDVRGFGGRDRATPCPTNRTLICERCWTISVSSEPIW